MWCIDRSPRLPLQATQTAVPLWENRSADRWNDFPFLTFIFAISLGSLVALICWVGWKAMPEVWAPSRQFLAGLRSAWNNRRGHLAGQESLHQG